MAHRPLSNLLLLQPGFRLSLSVSQGSPTPSASSTLTKTQEIEEEMLPLWSGDEHHILKNVSCDKFLPFSYVLDISLKNKTSQELIPLPDINIVQSLETFIMILLNTGSYSSEILAASCLKPPRLLHSPSFSPPAVHPECASACAPNRSVFAPDSPKPGSSGLSV